MIHGLKEQRKLHGSRKRYCKFALGDQILSTRAATLSRNGRMREREREGALTLMMHIDP